MFSLGMILHTRIPLLFMQTARLLKLYLLFTTLSSAMPIAAPQAPKAWKPMDSINVLGKQVSTEILGGTEDEVAQLCQSKCMESADANVLGLRATNDEAHEYHCFCIQAGKGPGFTSQPKLAFMHTTLNNVPRAEAEKEWKRVDDGHVKGSSLKTFPLTDPQKCPENCNGVSGADVCGVRENNGIVQCECIKNGPTGSLFALLAIHSTIPGFKPIRQRAVPVVRTPPKQPEKEPLASEAPEANGAPQRAWRSYGAGQAKGKLIAGSANDVAECQKFCNGFKNKEGDVEPDILGIREHRGIKECICLQYLENARPINLLAIHSRLPGYKHLPRPG